MTIRTIIEQNNIPRYDMCFLHKSELGFIRRKIKKHKYIDICSFWYDDKKNPKLNTWVDVEGIGYGWIWCTNKLRRKSMILQRRAVRQIALNSLKNMKKDNLIIMYSKFEEEYKILYFGFMHGTNEYVQIRLCNEELSYM